MILNKIMFAGVVMLISISFYAFVASGTTESQQPGAIIVAHGSINPEWNQQIEDFYDNIKSSIQPSKLAFLRFDTEKTMTKAVKELKNDGIGNIVLVHLSPSSYSIRHEELVDYAADTNPDPSLELIVSPAIDDHHLVVETLKDYAKELSQEPENESLILLADGPADELDNIAWLRKLDRIGKMIRLQVRFSEVVSMTLRNYSADLIQEKAMIDLRKTVKRLSEKGRVIILPYMLWQGSFYDDLQSYLRGIASPEKIAISDQNVITHPNIAQWVKKVMKKGMNQPSVMPVNRNWSAHNAEMGGECSYEYGRAKIEKNCDAAKK